MKSAYLVLVTALFSLPSFAQVRVEAHPDQQALLASDDPQLAANKQTVHDFWRYALIGRNMEMAQELMHEDYIQHNPNIATGRAPFVAFFGSLPQNPVPDDIPGLVSLVAEGDLVTISFVRECEDPRNEGETYTTTWFDMFRVTDGVITEHWDYGTIGGEGNPPDCTRVQ